MKRTIALAMLVVMFSVVSADLSHARMDREVIPTRLDPVPEERCFCETMYCDCVYDCGTPWAMCVLVSAVLGRGFFTAWDDCDILKEVCIDDCESTFGHDVQYTCEYGVQDQTPEEIINQCLRDCQQNGGSRMDCYAWCDMI